MHSTLAHIGKKERVIPTQTPYEAKGQNIHIKLSLRDTQVPSLENWGGGLKSRLWLADSPHTPKRPQTHGQVQRKIIRNCHLVDSIAVNIWTHSGKINNHKALKIKIISIENSVYTATGLRKDIIKYL